MVHRLVLAVFFATIFASFAAYAGIDCVTDGDVAVCADDDGNACVVDSQGNYICG